MHPAPGFAWTDRAAMTDFISAVSFGTLFIPTPEGARIAHAPVVVEGPDRLRFHLSRRNAAANAADGEHVLLSVLGPAAYVSPDWYDSEDQVPTWNYIVVECEGSLRRLSEEELSDLLDKLSALHETRLAPKPPWTRDKLTPARFDAMLKAIVGFELSIETMQGTRKLGQNKRPAERAGASAGLRAIGRDDMARLMEEEP